MAIVTGKIYDDTGALFFDGTYDDSEFHKGKPIHKIEGTMYHKNGNKFREGIFQRAGLLVGKEYYESGALKFEGKFNDKRFPDDPSKAEVDTKADKGYYGPSYPVEGKFYAEDGTLIYEGKFDIGKQGSVGYPRVIFPEGYGSLH